MLYTTTFKEISLLLNTPRINTLAASPSQRG
jgi:hypothetical protein